MKDRPVDSVERTAPSVIDRRRSQRVVIRIGVTIYVTVPGKNTTHKCHTLDVNAHGALVASPVNFPQGAHFVLENNQTRERQSCRVTRKPHVMADSFQVPVEFEKAAPNFWKITFPPPDWKPLEG